eukprot:gene14103-20060_t
MSAYSIIQRSAMGARSAPSLSLPAKRVNLVARPVAMRTPCGCSRGRSSVVRVVAFKTELTSNTGIKLPIECQQLLGLKAGESVRDSMLDQAYDDLLLGLKAGESVRDSMLDQAYDDLLLGLKAGESVRDSMLDQAYDDLLLGLKAGESVRDSMLNQAYDDLVESPLEQGYSKETIQGRMELLEIARHDVITNKSCRPELRSKEVTIPYDLIPASLAVLSEVGQSDMVIYLGKELLMSPELEGNQQLKNDVIISMALAYCDMAGDLIESQNLITAGCRYLEDAQQLLNSSNVPAHVLAPNLAHNISEGLASLQAQAALEELSAPASAPTSTSIPSSDTNDKEMRQRAVRSVKDVLRNADAANGNGSSPSPDLLRQLMSQLTCEEVVHLQEWQSVAKNMSKHKWAYPGLIENVAYAHIVAGFQQRQPTYVKMAMGLLQGLPSSSDVLIARGVSKVLLGAVKDSSEELKKAEAKIMDSGNVAMRGSPRQAEGWKAAPHTFVLDNSPSGDDGLLPGMCMFTEMWLTQGHRQQGHSCIPTVTHTGAQVAFPMFRETASGGIHAEPLDTASGPTAVSLSQYFDDARVEALITVYDERSSSLNISLSSMLARFKAMEPMKKKAIAAGATALLVIAALSAFLGRDRGQIASIPIPLPAASAVYADTMTDKVAENLIKSWQAAKQTSMGPTFESRSLMDVLSEPVLSETLKKGADFKQQGYFMRYTLWKCKVLSLDESRLSANGNGHVNVVAELDESAALYGVDGRQEDGYRSSYDAQYKIVKSKDGSWRISQVTVLGQEPQ